MYPWRTILIIVFRQIHCKRLAAPFQLLATWNPKMEPVHLGWWGRQEGNKMGVQKFEDLIKWQKAMDLVEEIYWIVKLLPDEGIYALSAQMRRAVVSIPSNIAEGQERNTTKDFINFLYTARGSKAELETQLLICIRLSYMTQVQIKTARGLLTEIGKMLNSLIKKLDTSH